MPEPADQPAKHGRSLVGFYIALGVVAVLVGLGAWLWTPLKISYCERRVLDSSLFPGQRSESGERLARTWPAAAPAVERLLRSDSHSRKAMLNGLVWAKATWCLPLLAAECQRQDGSSDCAMAIALSAQKISGQDFGGKENAELAVQNFLSWWEREGQAKYGGGGK